MWNKEGIEFIHRKGITVLYIIDEIKWNTFEFKSGYQEFALEKLIPNGGPEYTKFPNYDEPAAQHDE